MTGTERISLMWPVLVLMIGAHCFIFAPTHAFEHPNVPHPSQFAYLLPPQQGTTREQVERPYAKTIECKLPFGRKDFFCTHDWQCFNSTRCLNRPFKILTYDVTRNSHIHHILEHDHLLKSYFTSNPDEACLFFPARLFGVWDVDAINKLKVLPYWNHGINHLVWEMGPGPLPEDIETLGPDKIKVLQPDLSIRLSAGALDVSPEGPTYEGHFFRFRPSLDVSVPVNPPSITAASFQNKDAPRVSLRGSQRQYRLMYHVPPQVQHRLSKNPAVVKKIRDLYESVSDSKKYIIEWTTLKQAPVTAANARYTAEQVQDLTNSTFCLLPEGWGLRTARLLDCMRWGSIPVIVSDSYVPPLQGLLDWDTFSVRLSNSNVKDLKHVLDSFSPSTVDAMQRRMLYVYQNYFFNSATWIRKALNLIQRRIHCRELTSMCEAHFPQTCPRGQKPAGRVQALKAKLTAHLHQLLDKLEHPAPSPSHPESREAYWFVSAWQPCSKNCGGGVRTRDVFCTDKRLHVSIAETDPVCKKLGPKPSPQEACNTRKC